MGMVLRSVGRKAVACDLPAPPYLCPSPFGRKKMDSDEGVVRKKVRRPMDKFRGSIRGPLRLRASVPKKHQEGNRTVYPRITLNNREHNKTQDFPENAFFTTKYVQ